MSDSSPQRPRRHRQALVTWLAIYPSITLVLWLFQPLGLLQLPLPLRTLVLTALLVPMMVYALVPMISRALDRRRPSPDNAD